MGADPVAPARASTERLLRPLRVSLPPIRRREFWTVQALVLAIAVAHTLLETVLRVELPGPLYLIPTSLFFIPVVYAALAFGVRGSVLTALWSIVLTLPNILVLHDGLSRLGIIWQQGILLAVAVFVGLRVDQQRLAQAEAEARERELEASEQRYRALFDGAAEAVLVIGEDGTIEEANEAAAGLLELDLPAMLGRPAAQVLGSEIAAVLVAGGPTSTPMALPKVVGTQVTWVEPLASGALLDPEGVRRVQAILHDVTLQHERQQGLERYARRGVAAREDERRRIGRELHDGPLQSLMLAARMLEGGDEGLTPAPHPGSGRDEAAVVLEDAADELRRISRALRPSILDDLGLVQAIRSEASALARRTGLAVRSGILGEPRPLSPEVELMLLRVTQEALHNVERHAQASRAWVRLAFGRRSAWLVIRDDGRGPRGVPSASDLLSAGKLGLVGMEERARLAGADFAMRANARAGTSIIVTVPTPTAEIAASARSPLDTSAEMMRPSST